MSSEPGSDKAGSNDSGSSDVGQVTLWIDSAKSGDEQAIHHLWDYCFEKLMRVARKRLQGSAQRVSDEEDVALSAFHSFCAGVSQGKYPELHDRDNLWRILVVITVRKALDAVEHQRRQKRGGGMVRGESVFMAQAFESTVAGLGQAPGDEPTPEFALQVAEECERLLDVLQDETLRSICLWKLEGFTNEEISQKLGCTVRSVERKLQLIRRKWSEEERDGDKHGADDKHSDGEKRQEEKST